MEKLKNLSFATKTLLIASGVVATSAGAYLLYRSLKRKPNDLNEREKKNQINCNRQPSENIDENETVSGKKVLVLGMEKAGKTCLLAALTHEETERQYQPTQGFNVVCITNTDKRLDIMEIGGLARYREHWNKFAKDTSVLVYVIDSSNGEFLSDTLDALKEVLKFEELADIPVIVVFSKRDHGDAIPINDLVNIVESEQLDSHTFEYASVQVQCGGAPKTDGAVELQERLTQLC